MFLEHERVNKLKKNFPPSAFKTFQFLANCFQIWNVSRVVCLSNILDFLFKVWKLMDRLIEKQSFDVCFIRLWFCEKLRLEMLMMWEGIQKFLKTSELFVAVMISRFSTNCTLSSYLISIWFLFDVSENLHL